MTFQSNICCYINKNKHIYKTFAWPFPDLSFLLLHTNNKVATHLHLQNLNKKLSYENLSAIADSTLLAMQQQKTATFIECVNQYFFELKHLDLIAKASLDLIAKFKKFKSILAIKGCGALGADIILVIIAKTDKNFIIAEAKKIGLTIIGSENDFFPPIKLVS